MKIGKGTIEMQSENTKDIHKFGALYGALPSVCDECKSEDIYLSYRKKKDGGFEYYSVNCKKCGAALNFGQKKEGGFFVKEGEKMTKYIAEK
jgi:hypothetical protein